METRPSGARIDADFLIFRSASGAPMAADITLTATTFQAGIPKQLFATPPVPWSVTGDGKRFLVSMPPVQGVQVQIYDRPELGGCSETVDEQHFHPFVGPELAVIALALAWWKSPARRSRPSTKSEPLIT